MIRLGRLDLTRWGSFTDRTLDFGEADGRLHLVYGGNAAGKSTTRRATTALLFGIPTRTPDAHTHDYADLRIGAQLLTDDGAVEVVRRKGKVNTLLGPDGQPLHDDPIGVALHALTAEAYGGLFEISHESLVDGGRELLAGHGAVGESLFAAAAGTGRLHRLLGALDSDAADLFKTGGRNARLNVALAEHSTATKELSAATVRPTRAGELRRAPSDTRRVIEELDGTIREHERECGRLRRLKAVKPMLARHSELVLELEGLGKPPALGSDAAERRGAAQRDRDDSDRASRTAQGSLATLRQTHSQQADPGDMLSHSAAITETHSQIAAIRKAASDRRKREGELQREEARLEGLLARIGAGMQVDELDVHIAQERTRQSLDRCLDSRGEIAERHRSARTRTTDAERALEAAQNELTSLPEAVGTAALRAAVRAATKLGPVEDQAAEHRATADALRAEAENRLARLAPRPTPLEELERQSIPTRDAIDRVLATKLELDDQQSAIDNEREQIDRRAADLAGRGAGLRARGQAPTAQELEAGRTQRDEDWQTVRRALVTPAPDADQRAEQFERSMAGADQVADARAAQADKLAQAAEIDATNARTAAEREALGERVGKLERRRSLLETEWQTAWKPSEMRPPAIVDAPEWLREHESICKLVQEARSAAGKAELAEQAAARHGTALLEHLADTNGPAPAGSTLEGAIALAESLAGDFDDQNAKRRTTQKAVEDAERTLARERSDLAQAETEHEAWREQWQRLRATYGLDSDVAPEDASQMLRTIDDALSARDSVGALRHRIEGIDRDSQEFAAEVARICRAVAPDLSGVDPEDAASEVMDRLGNAQRAREAIDGLNAQIERHEGDLADANQRRERAQEQLDAMVGAAGATEEDELADIERRSARAAELRHEIPTCEREVAQAGEEAFEGLFAAATEFSGEQLDADISEHGRKLKALREERDRAQEAAFEARDQLERAERSDCAGKAAEKAQQHLAGARDLAERYAVARLSSCLLRETIERYRTKHQGPMLARANELFPSLTRETFTELYVDWNDAEEPILVGRDKDGRPLRVEHMSDGTREQLFLALRIAAIERYVDSSGGVPVLFDDVFLESDDPRSERILSALADLAVRTQVIVFTHHRHLVALAQQALDPSRLALHDLDGGPPQLRADGQAALRRAAA